MKSSNVMPAANRQRQTNGLETLLLWAIIAIGLAGVIMLFSGTASRDTAAIAVDAPVQQTTERVVSLDN